jgi:hypothetical protein
VPVLNSYSLLSVVVWNHFVQNQKWLLHNPYFKGEDGERRQGERRREKGKEKKRKK